MPYNCLEHCKEEIYQKQHIDVDTKPPIVGGARARCAGQGGNVGLQRRTALRLGALQGCQVCARV